MTVVTLPALGDGWVLAEPRRKTCGLRAPCGRCWNCASQAWRKVWQSLLPEDREWVRDQLLLTLVWAGQDAPERGTFRWRFFAEPPLTEYVLR